MQLSDGPRMPKVLKANHVPMLSQPDSVAALIEAAKKAPVK